MRRAVGDVLAGPNAAGCRVEAVCAPGYPYADGAIKPDWLDLVATNNEGDGCSIKIPMAQAYDIARLIHRATNVWFTREATSGDDRRRVR